ncbi:MAG: LptA/OstA family protein [Nitrospirota bacterium]|jgi:lipopolysaccharide export system protein LptA
MLRLLSNIKPFLFIILLISYSIAEGKELIDKEERTPIVITSQRMTAVNEQNRLIFEKDVVAKKDDIVLYADKMEILFNKTKDAGLIDAAAKEKDAKENRDISTITATGNVKVVRGEKTITANEAVYYKEEDKIVLTGEPKAWEKDDVVTGTRMTIFLKEDKSIVEGSKVVVHPDKKGKKGLGSILK